MEVFTGWKKCLEMLRSHREKTLAGKTEGPPFLKFFFMFIFERERVCKPGGAEREGGRRSKAGSVLSVQSPT